MKNIGRKRAKRNTARAARRTGAAIRLEGVTKQFLIPHEKDNTLFGKLNGFIKKKLTYEELLALRDVNLTIEKGEFMGIIGPNGSGKTTLLKVMAGIISPTEGIVHVNGRIAPLLSLGTGFESELTARENIFLSGSIMGFSKKEISDKMHDIISFAELDRFIDMPLKNYSSGMYSRLAFAMALHTKGDVYLIDEIFSVGDEAFQKKCVRLFREIRKEGKTVIYVSHNLDSIRKLCKKAILLDAGRIEMEGRADEVVKAYEERMKAKNPLEKEIESLKTTVIELEESKKREGDDIKKAMIAQQKSLIKSFEEEKRELKEKHIAEMKDLAERNLLASSSLMNAESELRRVREEYEEVLSLRNPGRWGNRDVEITGVEVIGADGMACESLARDDVITVRLSYKAKKPVAEPMFGVAIHSEEGLVIVGPNNILSGNSFRKIEGEGSVYCTLENPGLNPGRYLLSAAIHRKDQKTCFDYHNKMYSFTINPDGKETSYGAIESDARWEIRR